MSEVDFIILINCLGTLTNMTVNGEMLELAKKHYEQEKDLIKSILEQLEILNERLKNGT